MKYQELSKQYQQHQLLWKINIRLTTNTKERIIKRIKYLVVFPWQWLWVNIRDWHTLLIFIIVCAVVGSEVWVPYLLYFITGEYYWLGIGSGCLLFWVGPGTPFILICIFITIGVKALLNKRKQAEKACSRKD